MKSDIACSLFEPKTFDAPLRKIQVARLDDAKLSHVALLATQPNSESPIFDGAHLLERITAIEIFNQILRQWIPLSRKQTDEQNQRLLSDPTDYQRVKIRETIDNIKQESQYDADVNASLESLFSVFYASESTASRPVAEEQPVAKKHSKRKKTSSKKSAVPKTRYFDLNKYSGTFSM